MTMESRPVRLTQVLTVPISLGFLRGQPPYLRERGIETTVITSPGDALDAFAAREEVRAIAVSMSREISPVPDLVSLVRLVRIFLTTRPEIVHSQTPKAGLLGMIAAWLTRRPIRVYSILGLKYATATGRRRLLLQSMERLSCRLATSVTCVSQSIRAEAIGDRLAPADKLRVLAGGTANGVDAVNRFNPDLVDPGLRARTRQSQNIPESALVVGFIGRIVKDKGIAELASAWTTVRDAYPHAHLAIVGPEEVEDPVDPAIMAALAEDPRAHLVGSVADPLPWYAAVDLIVLPTYREGFPNVPLEAAAMGVPVVATNVPGCTDAVADGVTGTLVPVREAELLSRAISDYLDNAELRCLHGTAGRRRVLAEFQQEAIWAALNAEYARLLNANG